MYKGHSERGASGGKASASRSNSDLAPGKKTLTSALTPAPATAKLPQGSPGAQAGAAAKGDAKPHVSDDGKDGPERSKNATAEATPDDDPAVVEPTSAQAGGGALVFQTASFTPMTGGPLTAHTDHDSVGLRIYSSFVTSVCNVHVRGGTNLDVQGWDVGFIQTVHESEHVGHYIPMRWLRDGGNQLETSSVWTRRLPNDTRDGRPGGAAPWYDSNNSDRMRPFEITGQAKQVTFTDQPQILVPWSTPHIRRGLVATNGKDRFTTWTIVRHRASPNVIHFINWQTWEVDYSTRTEYPQTGIERVTAILGGTRVTGSGDGQGPSTPNLDGAVANTLVRDGEWT